MNEKNQIEFQVERESGSKDVLSFRGSWKVGESNEIVYSWRKTKASGSNTLVFKGFWGLSEDRGLSYTLQGASDETFRLSGAFQTKSILAKKGEIRYQLGAALEGKLGRTRTLTLFGKWKLSDKLSLVFEMESGTRKKSELHFGAEYQFTKDMTCSASLTGKSGEPLGVEVVFARSFFEGNAQTFVRLKRTLAESAVENGVSMHW